MKNKAELPAAMKTLDDLRAFYGWLQIARALRGPVSKEEADQILKLVPVALRMVKRMELDITMTSLGCVARSDMTRLKEFYEVLDRTHDGTVEWVQGVPI